MKAKHIVLPTKFPGYGYKLPVKPRSATNMWEVWFGIGSHHNLPVRGGISTMEKEYTGWRKMYTSSERKQFSRWKTAIKLMQDEAAVLGGTSNALKELDGIFTAVSPFVDALKDRKKRREAADESPGKSSAQIADAQIADAQIAYV